MTPESTNHKKQWEFLTGKFEGGRLSHAYIFSGPQEADIQSFAKEFIKFINCLGQKKSCGVCKNCISIERGQFPDVLHIDSSASESSLKNEKDMMEIDVDQIRQVNNFLSLTSYYGGYKSVIINNADRLNSQAQHAFLKNLEEPKGKTIIIFMCQQPELLLDTIVSRCQNITFFPEKNQQAIGPQEKMLLELRALIGAPLADKFSFAKKANLEGSNFNGILNVLERELRELLLVKIGVLEKKDLRAQTGAHDYSLEQLKKIITLISALRKNASNQKLALEILLLELY